MRIKKNLVWRRIGDDALILLDLETGRYNSLNKSAAIVWGALIKGEDSAGCTEVLTQMYPGLQTAEARKEVEALIENFKNRELLIEGKSDGEIGHVDLEFETLGEFVPPACEEHEALQEVTAGSYSSGGYSYTYYYYYYYYY